MRRWELAGSVVVLLFLASVMLASGGKAGPNAGLGAKASTSLSSQGGGRLTPAQIPYLTAARAQAGADRGKDPPRQSWWVWVRLWALVWS